VLITSALDTIIQSKEARRSAPFKEATQRALDMVNTGAPQTFDPRVLFEPLRMACETGNEKLMIASLDCIAKLISYSFFAEPEGSRPYVSPQGSPTSATPANSLPLSDLIAITITSAYTESTPDPVALQIVKALLALVLSTTIVVHHSSLLKAVRTIYNVFLLSQNPSNQLVAQGGLTQIVHHVFSRCDMEVAAAEYPMSAQTPKLERRSLAFSPIPENVPLPPITPREEHFQQESSPVTQASNSSREQPNGEVVPSINGHDPNGALNEQDTEHERR
jgi:brefeldin A-inhibited guanine nucleotide-exchange protein